MSLMAELEAADWYNQPVDACNERELKAILAHNRLPRTLCGSGQVTANPKQVL